MIRSATITYQAADNYGAFLQAYALQRYIMDELGSDNVILNLVTPHMREHYSLLKKPVSPEALAKNLMTLTHYGALKKRKESFDRARASYLVLSERFSDAEGYKRAIEGRDMVITGSDQVWNLASEDFSELFFAPWAKRRISYAASMGVRTYPEWEDIFRRELSDFERISVREPEALEFIRSGAGRQDCRLCIDPVLLVDRSVFERMEIRYEGIPEEAYIIFYSVKNPDSSYRLASELSRILGLSVYVIFSRLSSVYKAKKYSLGLVADAGPAEFISLLKDAKYVFSDSFHGIAMSVVMEKCFFWLRGREDEKDDRIKGLLGSLELMHRAVWDEQSFRRAFERDLDWKKIRDRLETIRASSESFLRSAFD